MSKFIAKAYTMAFVATVSMTAIAADAPGAFTPNEFAAIMAKMPTPTELGGVQVHAKQFCGSCHGSHGVAQTANWPACGRSAQGCDDQGSVGLQRRAS